MNLRSLPQYCLSTITNPDWMHKFDAASLKKGRTLLQKNAVHLYDLNKRGNYHALLFDVNDKYTHETDIILSRNNHFEAECDCPSLDPCEHMAAAMYYLNEQLGNSIKTDNDPNKVVDKKLVKSTLSNWLGSLSDTIKDQGAEDILADQNHFTEKLKDRVVYVIETNYEGSIRLAARRGRLNKTGNYKINSSLVKANLQSFNKANYVSPIDFDIVSQIQRHSDNYYGESILPVDSPHFVKVIKQCAQLGRLLVDMEGSKATAAHNPLELSQTRILKPSWQTESTTALKPIISIEPEAEILLSSTPKLYIDLSHHQIGEVEQSHSEEFLQQWQKGPHIPASELDTVQQLIQQTQETLTEAVKASNTSPKSIAPIAEVSIPVPPKVELYNAVKPLPILSLQRVELDSNSSLFFNRGSDQILLAQLSFSYDGHRILYNSKDNHLQVYQNNTVLKIARDMVEEQKWLDQLEALNLKTAELLFDDLPLTHKHAPSFLFSNAEPENTQSWLLLLNQKQLELEQNGWEVEILGDLGYQIQEFEDIYEELEESNNDWFRFDLGIEFEGKRISLVPALAQAISSGMYENYTFSEEPDARIPIAIPFGTENNFVNFPAQRFKLILDKVRDLFLYTNESDEIEIPRLRAATVADELDMAKANKTLIDLAEMGRQLSNLKGLPKTRVPKNLNAELRDYQVEGFRWLQFLAKYKLHGVLADDMGLGKTLQALTHILAEKNSRRNNKLPTLVIAPTSVIPNWKKEAAKFTPSLSVLLLHGNERKQHFDQIEKHDIVITSYALLQRDQIIHTKQAYHIVVLDESQYIKNAAAKTTKIACKLTASHRICLSGTPMENHLGELWSTFNFLMPGLLQSREKFNKAFRRPIEREGSTVAQSALQRRVGPLLLRRTKDVVAKELPPKTHIDHNVALNQEQVDLYESVRASMDKRVRDAITAKGISKSQIIILDALLKLRQICCHPQLLKIDAAQQIEQSGKLDYLSNLLGTLIEEDRRIIIFSQFTKMLGLIEKHLKKENIDFVKITGATRNREKPVERFQRGEVPVFLISLKAGGTGLNLTAADTVIHYDPWWNPAAENQATDRAYRIGQKNPVFVHKLICQGTIEEHIQQLQEKKAKLVESLLSGSTNKLQLDQETLTGLLAPIEL